MPVGWVMSATSRNHSPARRLCVMFALLVTTLAGVDDVDAEDLAVDFGANGLWQLGPAGWAYATDLDPVVLAAWDNGLAASFTDDSGFWSYDGASWAQLTVWEPYDAVAFDGHLVASFDSDRGVWLYESSSWRQLTPWEPVHMEAAGSRLLASFGAGKGLWTYDGAWSELTSWHPDAFVPWNGGVVASFDSGRGVWFHDGSSWRQWTHWEATTLAPLGNGVAMVLEPDLGLWLHDGSAFSQLAAWKAYAIVSDGDSLIVASGEERGLWRYQAAGGWTQLAGWEPIHLEVSAAGLVADFGFGRGLWTFDDSNGWVNATTWNGEKLDSLDPLHRGAEDPLGVASDVADVAYCQDVQFWNPSWRRLEEEILQIVNQRRGEGASCGSEGTFAPTGPVSAEPALRCAARMHSKDMVIRNFFDHTNPDGESPWDRFGNAGYSFSSAGENIAAGNATAAATMNQWMGSDGHCANLMTANFTELGVGYYPGGPYGHYWTQAFARPR